MRLQSTLVAALLIAVSSLTGAKGADMSARLTGDGQTGSTVSRQTPAQQETTVNATVPTELVMTDVKTGTGPAITAGQTAVVHYTGWLYSPTAKDHKGKKFDSSRDRNDPFSFHVGGGEVIGGWDQGVVGMLAGGQRQLVIPPALGYGARGAGGVIPPNATLLFDIELLKIQ
jgi:FKBP-type peptidyl-prolyl cis-trans isomerase